MGIETLIAILIWLVVIFIIAYVAYYVITTFFDAPLQKVLLAVTGLILLIAILYMIAGNVGPLRIPK